MNSMEEPTEAQHKVLARMAGGAEVTWVKGIQPYCYYRGSGDRINRATMMVLDRRGWIRIKKDDWRWADYEISDEGRAAIGAESDG